MEEEVNPAATPSVSASDPTAEPIVYALPKEYNGKTVNDLFPEFEHNKVLKFSKLLGFGRITSLPKVWKGVRKRKKSSRLSESGNDISSDAKSSNLKATGDTALKTIPEESVAAPMTAKTDRLNSIDDINNDEDAFKLFDDEFSDKNKMLEKKMDTDVAAAAAEEPPKIEQVSEDATKETISETANDVNSKEDNSDELEYETDDEIDFLKPFYLNINKSSPSEENALNQAAQKSLISKSTWINGPASFWYEHDDIYAVLSNKKLQEQQLLEKSLKRLKKENKRK
jgi:hypothetical protein